MKLSTRKARKLRAKVKYIGFCPVRPGLLHNWEQQTHLDPNSFGAVLDHMECTKCQTWRWDI